MEYLLWFIIYILISIATYLVWLSIWYNLVIISSLPEKYERQLTYKLWFFILLFFNVLANKYWTFIFFKSKAYLVGLILILFMFVTAVPIIVLLYLSKCYVAASLFIPYPLWLIYAFILNLILIELNLILIN